jgi:RNA polymerase sigma factor (sigma-70 family)
MTAVGSGWDLASDAELITAVRAGDSSAFGVLYERHAPAARSVARQYSNSHADAEDAVADAFSRVFAAIRTGGGPDVAFRAYLFTVLRRVAMHRVETGRRAQPTDDLETFEAATGPGASTEEPAMLDFERGVVSEAFRSLPERWQAVLWYTEVEQMAPADIAPVLGLTANGVAALAYRAREGLRQAYLQKHLAAPLDDACRIVNAKLGSYVRGGLAKRETALVESHLDECLACRALVLELGDVNHGMRVVIAPLVLGAVSWAVLEGVGFGGAVAAGAAAAGSAVGGGAGAASGSTGSASGGAGAGAAGGAGSAGVSSGASVGAGAGAGLGGGVGSLVGAGSGIGAGAGMATGAAVFGGAAVAGVSAARTAGASTPSAAGGATAGAGLTSAAAGAGAGTATGLAGLLAAVPAGLLAAAAAVVVAGGLVVAGAVGLFSSDDGAVVATGTAADDGAADGIAPDGAPGSGGTGTDEGTTDGGADGTGDVDASGDAGAGSVGAGGDATGSTGGTGTPTGTATGAPTGTATGTPTGTGQPGTTPATPAPTDPAPSDPGTDPGPTDPTDPTDPGTDPTDPGTDPTDPGTDPTDPGTDPTDPGTDPTDPGTDPTAPEPFVALTVDAPRELLLQAGSPGLVTVTVTNTGTAAADEIRTELEFTDGTSWRLEAVGTPTGGGFAVRRDAAQGWTCAPDVVDPAHLGVCTVEGLAPGATTTLRALLVVEPASLDGEVDLPVGLRTWAPGHTARPAATLLPGVLRSRPADLRVADGAPVLLKAAVGDAVVERLEVPVHNAGGTTAREVRAVVSTTGVPDGVLLRGAADDAWSCVADGPAALLCFAVDLRPGEHRPVVLELVAPPTDALAGTGPLDVAADAVVEVRVDGAVTSGRAQVRVESADAVLRTEVVAPSVPVTAGADRALVVRVTNAGGTSAAAVPVSVAAPEPLTVSGPGWTACDAGLCREVDVPVGGTVELTAGLAVPALPVGEDRSLPVSVTVAGETSTTDVRVVGPQRPSPAALVVTTQPTTLLEQGVPGTVVATVRNDGGTAARDVELEVELPNAVFLVESAACTPAQGSQATVTCTVEEVPAYGSVDVDVGVLARGAAADREVRIGVRGTPPEARAVTTIIVR